MGPILLQRPQERNCHGTHAEMTPKQLAPKDVFRDVSLVPGKAGTQIPEMISPFSISASNGAWETCQICSLN